MYSYVKELMAYVAYFISFLYFIFTVLLYYCFHHTSYVTSFTAVTNSHIDPILIQHDQ